MAENKGLNAMPMKVKIALLALCPLVIIALCAGVIILYAGSMVEEGIYTPPIEKAEYLSIVPEADGDKLAAINAFLTDAQQSGQTQITCTDMVDLYGLESDLSDAQKNLLVFASGSIEGGLSAMTEGQTLAYGETASLFAPFASDKTEISFTANEEIDRFIYSLQTENTFADTDTALFAAAKEQFSEVFNVLSENITPIECEAIAVVNPYTNHIESINYDRIYHMEYTVDFIGDLAELGTKTLTFDCRLTRSFSVTWAGLTVTKKQIVLNKNGYEGLSMTVNIEENAPADSFKLTFVSSDESIATVDESGLIEAVSLSENPVTITATLEYLGNTYTDTCEVLVIIEPESVKMNTGAQQLKIGESVELDAEVKPNNATIQNIFWVSLDESVAIVDENGLVTAVGEGKTQILAISEIASCMAGCTISVQGGAE